MTRSGINVVRKYIYKKLPDIVQQRFPHFQSVYDLSMCSLTVKMILSFLVALQSVAAFVPDQVNRLTFAPLAASQKPISEKVSQLLTTTAVIVSTSPVIALAEEPDGYEYGAVNAPIGIAWAGGVFAILTALLPLALRSGEEAFEEMKERDAGKWGTGNTDALKKKK